jgi:hypothetical protein
MLAIAHVVVAMPAVASVEAVEPVDEVVTSAREYDIVTPRRLNQVGPVPAEQNVVT